MDFLRLQLSDWLEFTRVTLDVSGSNKKFYKRSKIYRIWEVASQIRSGIGSHHAEEFKMVQ